MIIKDKINDIKGFLQELSEIVPSDIGLYKRSLEKKAACERYLEKIMEAVVDLAFLVIKEKNLKLPGDDEEAFKILVDNNIILKELGSNLKDAKGMRNFIIHQYDKIDDELVFESVSNELERDVKEFINIIKLMFKDD
ncbi:MAG: DUF86 domain-containing protein [archaeon]